MDVKKEAKKGKADLKNEELKELKEPIVEESVKKNESEEAGKKEPELQESNQEVKLPESRRLEIYWVLGVMAGLVAIFFVSYYFFQSLNHFEYQITGLTFYKEKIGEIQFYHSQFPMERPTGEKVLYNLYLRTDPRKNEIPVTGEIELTKNRPLFVTISPAGLESCTYSQVALASLSSFLTGAGFQVKGAVVDEEFAKNTETPIVKCDSSPFNNVILVQSGEETKIEKQENGCYVLSVNNCEILPAVEKFELQAIADARTRKYAALPL